MMRLVCFFTSTKYFPNNKCEMLPSSYEGYTRPVQYYTEIATN